MIGGRGFKNKREKGLGGRRRFDERIERGFDVKEDSVKDSVRGQRLGKEEGAG